MIRLCLVALLLAPSALAQETDPPPAVDQAALAPILSHSWSADGSCSADLMDWVIDRDGWPYLRELGFTPLTKLEFAGGVLTMVDAVGIGSTTATYKLNADGTLRLWSRVFVEGDEADGAGPPLEQVKDGHVVLDDSGKPVSPGAETPAMKPCAPRGAVVPADAIAALNGVWGPKTGEGICPAGADAVTFDLDRPIPTILRGPFGEAPFSTAWALGIEKDGEAWKVTEGSAFEASIYRFTPGADGTLTQASEYDDNKVVLARCP